MRGKLGVHAPPESVFIFTGIRTLTYVTQFGTCLYTHLPNLPHT